MRTARSSLYTVQASPSGTTYVIKVPARGDDAVDTEPPLDAETQFAALRRAHGWYRDDGDASVSRPVALLEDVGAVVMEHVPGPTVGQAVHRAPVHPRAAARAVAAAGRFLREFHRHAEHPGGTVSLGGLAQDVVTADRALLSPVGVRLPTAVRRTLLEIPDVAVPAGRVLLHGDYVPNNLVVTDPDRVTMLDPLLVRVGLPEDDAARFLAIVSSDTAFVAGVAGPPIRWLRRHLESQFRLAYGETAAHPAILELRLLQQHVLRWRRRREFSTLTQYPTLMNARARVIDSHMRTVLRESGHRLARSLRTSRPRGRVAAG
ncbi:phosphotransferase [Geodermatophilus sabuli]|nr:phosphotransferase [Geodermatophilus sabuli]MBB3086893.1 aminoglycoside phosphotransferase (APT) family kinase protein [Geodermatophilus sabuli]